MQITILNFSVWRSNFVFLFLRGFWHVFLWATTENVHPARVHAISTLGVELFIRQLKEAALSP